jgi:hypothetical protein
MIRDTELINFINEYGYFKNKTKDIGEIGQYKIILEILFNKSDLKKNIRKGWGIVKRREDNLLKFQKNILNNCIRKYNGFPILQFEEEYHLKESEYSDSDSDEEKTHELTSEEKNEIQILENLRKDLEEWGDDDKEIPEIKKAIEGIITKSKEKQKPKKEEPLQNMCKMCDSDLIIEGGFYKCIQCGIEGDAVQKQGYMYAGNISGANYIPGMEKMGLFIDQKFKDNHAKKMDTIKNLIEDYIRASKIDIDEDTIKGVAWSRLKLLKKKTLNSYKIKTVEIILYDLRRRGIKTLKRELSLMKRAFKIKDNIIYLLTKQEMNQEIINCLYSILDKKSQKLIKKYSNAMKWKIPSKEKVAAIIKFILIKKGTKVSIVTNLIKECGINATKYSNHYNEIKAINPDF